MHQSYALGALTIAIVILEDYYVEWAGYFTKCYILCNPHSCITVLVLSVPSLPPTFQDNSVTQLQSTILSMKLSPFSIKSSRAHSCLNWLQVETDVSRTIFVPIIRVVM
jgi:hypothetical protein